MSLPAGSARSPLLLALLGCLLAGLLGLPLAVGDLVPRRRIRARPVRHLEGELYLRVSAVGDAGEHPARPAHRAPDPLARPGRPPPPAPGTHVAVEDTSPRAP